MKKKVLIIVISFFMIIAMAISGFFIYISDYYHTDVAVIENLQTKDNIQVNTLDDGTIIAQPENAKVGLIFYPGGKVEYTAYTPLIVELAQKGIACALVEMPFNLSIFDENKANEILKLYPNIENWYMCGHSFGGVSAANHIAKYTDCYEGLILLASYSINDISTRDLKVISIYGSEDNVLNMKEYEKNKPNLPANFEEKLIPGGNHSQFGCYGKQAGDGDALITTGEQISVTVDYITNFIFSE